MWCRQCQQDVPVVRVGAAAPACPRCRGRLGSLADLGVELETFDQPVAPRLPTAPPAWQDDDAAADLKRIARRLRADDGTRRSRNLLTSGGADEDSATERLEPSEPPAGTIFRPAAGESPAHMSGASLAADVGLVGLIAGAATLAGCSEGLLTAACWPWGLGELTVGGALFTLGLLRLATQSSQHCRRLEREVAALRTQLQRRDAKPPRRTELFTRLR